MGYTITLGYEIGDDFELAFVRPFSAGSNTQMNPPQLERPTQELLASLSAQLDTTGETSRLHEDKPDSPDEDAEPTHEAELDVTSNYSSRIHEVTGTHLSALHLKRAADTGGLLLPLFFGLGDETDTDYWKPTDGNIKKIVSTLLDWTFQHPDATFRVT